MKPDNNHYLRKRIVMNGVTRDKTGLEVLPEHATMTLAEYTAKAKELDKVKAKDIEERTSLHTGRRTHKYKTKADGSMYKSAIKEETVVPPFVRPKGMLRCMVPERVWPFCLTGCYNRYDCKVYRGSKRRHRIW